MTMLWKPYTPTPAAPWDVRRVVHLHRRVGFAAVWPEIERDFKDGPVASIDRLLDGRSREGSVPSDYAGRTERLEELALASRRPAELRAAWIYRMLYGPDSLGERMTLLWHNHFATSNEKVNDVRAMVHQNDLFRQFGRAPFAELLTRLARDPALLVYLDAPANRKEHPNENLARELMELFTLGEGHFTEADIREAARALTGWEFHGATDNDGRALAGQSLESCVRYSPGRHDDGMKTVLGWRGTWSGEDLVRILLDHPATADRLAWRIATEFLGEGVATSQELAELAKGLRAGGLDIGQAVARVLRSERFFANGTIGRRVPGPVEWAVAAVRPLLSLDASPSCVQLSEWAARMGQSLFYPPNVGGWPGGRAWLSPLALLGRANLAADLVAGRLMRPMGKPLDVLALAQRHGRDGGRKELIQFLTELILGAAPAKDWVDRVCAAVGVNGNLAEFARRVVAAILASPEAQLA